MAMDTDLNCGDPRMTRTMRMIFRDTHNNLRGSIARGQTEKNGNWGIAPPATLMYRMKYDCEAEAYAMSHAQTCDRELLPPDERPGYKENIHVLDTVQTTPEGYDEVVESTGQQGHQNGHEVYAGSTRKHGQQGFQIHKGCGTAYVACAITGAGATAGAGATIGGGATTGAGATTGGGIAYCAGGIAGIAGIAGIGAGGAGSTGIAIAGCSENVILDSNLRSSL
ncbi:SCP-like protein [Ancylostoma ceylanicum]|uniref:SCP-like protein n=1 Tax=Ancylostoma ceylanicum TaxID=53326 RepID=A0A0D6L9A1_9BILA|nr:SCP-like protein [Ancylostoma ceylanicum]